MLSDDGFLTVKELADFLKLKPRSLYPKIWRGQLPAVKVFKEWRFKKSDIEKWLSENVRPNIRIQKENQAQQPIQSQS